VPGPLPGSDPGSARLALRATGLLADFNTAGVLESADVHVAHRVGALAEERDEAVLLALALAVRAVRHGSICVDLASVAEQPFEVTGTGDEDGATAPVLPWPDAHGWPDRVRASRLVSEGVLRIEDADVYLDRYWREEQQVCADLVTRLRRRAPEVDTVVLDAGIGRVFPAAGYDEQRAAVHTAAQQWTTILTGGPGTGKTTAVAGLLALVAEQFEVGRGRAPRTALAAPTGKAATRLLEAVAGEAERLPDEADRARVRGLESSTLHRLLGWRPDSSVRFRHHRGNRLPYDVVVVDETSMVSLTMMARLLEALRADTRLVLVGDPDQLSSVEAGAVLADLVGGFAGSPESPVVALRTPHRYGAGIGALAEALRLGDADRVVALLAGGTPEVEHVDPDDEDAMARFRDAVVSVTVDLQEAADVDEAERALDHLAAHRLLCAHREGRYGVAGWNRLVERLLTERTGVTTWDEWYVGRPVLVTANDRGQRLSNGDLGVTLREPDGRIRVVIADAQRRRFAPTRLPEVQTVHAMTVHKSQGSQARTVSVVMPPEDSRLLTRELFYTAVTRAQARARLVTTLPAIPAAVGRAVPPASGLERRLRTALAQPTRLR
jgi:exodeoxyribonuclease V alpha subunit